MYLCFFDGIDRLFIQAQIKAARGLLQGGKKEQARGILEDVIKEYPKQKATLEARKLLDQLR